MRRLRLHVRWQCHRLAVTFAPFGGLVHDMFGRPWRREDEGRLLIGVLLPTVLLVLLTMLLVKQYCGWYGGGWWRPTKHYDRMHTMCRRDTLRANGQKAHTERDGIPGRQGHTRGHHTKHGGRADNGGCLPVWCSGGEPLLEVFMGLARVGTVVCATTENRLHGPGCAVDNIAIAIAKDWRSTSSGGG